MHAFAIPFLLAVGGLLAVQAAANVQLSAALRSPVGASTLQLGIGAGLLGVEREPIDAAAVAGGIAVIAGAAAVVRAQAGGAASAALRGGRGWTLLGLVAGAVLPVQGAVNARLRADLDAPITAGAWSFVVAAGAMVLALTALRAAGLTPRPCVRALPRVPWWGWLGGLCGATYVTSVFLLIPEIGTAATIALTIGGQQLASLVVDRRGLLRLPRREVSAARLAGVALMLAGVAVVQLG